MDSEVVGSCEVGNPGLGHSSHVSGPQSWGRDSSESTGPETLDPFGTGFDLEPKGRFFQS